MHRLGGPPVMVESSQGLAVVARQVYHLAMGDVQYRTASRAAVVDASPLIYLAKLEALDVFREAGIHPLVPASVFEETTRPALAFRHPDAFRIEEAVTGGELEVIQTTLAEREAAEALAARIPQMHPGECEVLAMATGRVMPAVLFERRARVIARVLGVELFDLVDLLFDGTRDDDLLESRVREFGHGVNLRLTDLEALIALIQRRRLR